MHWASPKYFWENIRMGRLCKIHFRIFLLAVSSNISLKHGFMTAWLAFLTLMELVAYISSIQPPDGMFNCVQLLMIPALFSLQHYISTECVITIRTTLYWAIWHISFQLDCKCHNLHACYNAGGSINVVKYLTRNSARVSMRWHWLFFLSFLILGKTSWKEMKSSDMCQWTQLVLQRTLASV